MVALKWCGLAVVLIVATWLFIGGTTLAAQADIWHLTLAGPRSVTAGGPAAELVVSVRDTSGAPAPDGLAVTLTASLGLRVAPSLAPTAGGRAVVQLTPGTEAGFARLDAWVAGNHVDSVLWVRPAPAAHISDLVATPAQILTGGRAVLSGTVTDAFGNPAEGDEISWSASAGRMVNTSPRIDHGAVSADFVAGESPGPVQVRLTMAGAVADAMLTVVAPGPRAPPRPVWLPLAFAGATRAGTCADMLANGSFEVSGPAEEPLPGWSVIGGGQVRATAGQAPDGKQWLELAAAADDAPPAIRQTLTLPPGAQSAELWLWARGGDDAGLRLAAWTTVPVGSTFARAPVILDHLAVPESDWVRLAYRWPVAPSGTSSIELAPWSSATVAPRLAVDGVALRVCW